MKRVIIVLALLAAARCAVAGRRLRDEAPEAVADVAPAVTSSGPAVGSATKYIAPAVTSYSIKRWRDANQAMAEADKATAAPTAPKAPIAPVTSLGAWAPAVTSNAPAVTSNAPAVTSNAPAVTSNAPVTSYP